MVKVSYGPQKTVETRDKIILQNGSRDVTSVIKRINLPRT